MTRIQIIGAPESGKTNLARIIHNALIRNQSQHFYVSVIDEGKQVENLHRLPMEVFNRDIPETVIIEVIKQNDNLPAEVEAEESMPFVFTPGNYHLLGEASVPLKAMHRRRFANLPQLGFEEPAETRACVLVLGDLRRTISHVEMEHAVNTFESTAENITDERASQIILLKLDAEYSKLVSEFTKIQNKPVFNHPSGEVTNDDVDEKTITDDHAPPETEQKEYLGVDPGAPERDRTVYATEFEKAEIEKAASVNVDDLEKSLSEDANVVEDSEVAEDDEAAEYLKKRNLEEDARKEGIELDRRMTLVNMLQDRDKQMAEKHPPGPADPPGPISERMG